MSSIGETAENIYTAYIQILAREGEAFAKGNGFYDDSDVRNAIVHTFSSFELAYHRGDIQAELFGDLKEQLSDDPRDSWKDQWNNEIGRQMAGWARAHDYGPEIIDRLLLDAMEQGHLITDRNDPRVGIGEPNPSWDGPSEWHPEDWGTLEDPLQPRDYTGIPDPLGDLGDWFVGRLRSFLDGLADLGSRAIAALSDAVDAGIREIVKGLKDWLNDFLSDPIVLDLSGDGFQLTSLANSATFFDLDEDGLAERAGWVGASDALLVNDINGNGAVDGIGELVGSAISDGFDELALLDGNGDGKIDAADAAFGDLLVWRDVDGNGASTADELLTLAQANIVSLGLSYVEDGSEIEGNTVARVGSYLRGDGTSRDMASVWFALDQSVNPPTIPAGADVGDLIWLPRLAGAANIPDLTTAMYHDSALRAMVEDVVSGEVDFATVQQFIVEAFEPILYRWTGADATPPPGEEDSRTSVRSIHSLSPSQASPFP